MRYARDERLALCALLDQAGPREPTLCEGWATLELAAHLVLREHRPDAGPGLLGGPLAGYTGRVQRKLAERTPFPRLVETIRNGPPRLSVFALPGMDERVNLVEYFVHHEDVRRAQPDWEPRELGKGLADALWQRLGVARFLLRKAPVGVELARDDKPDSEPGSTSDLRGPKASPDASGRHAGSRVRITAKARTPVVTVTGPPGELTMWALGRTAAARVRLDGSEADVKALSTADWRL
ncbi:MAG TPA: TIGR03085 family metal-binding protein [Streptosporangiaceae bacterium]|nr:TIGR03085 family metal-binding protein [Streptosporangiaceae bacterium]